MDSAAQRKRNAQRMGGGGVHEILQPVNGYRGQLERNGVKPKDHAKANVAAMREAQRQNRERKAMEAHMDEDKFVLKEFKNVPSQVSKRVAADRQAAKARKEAVNNGNAPDTKFLKKGAREERDGSKPAPIKPFERPGAKKKSNLPMEVLRPQVAPERPQRDFQAENMGKVRQAKKEVLKQEGSSKPANYGKVPKYLKERQNELKSEQDELRRLAEMDVDCPPGMRRLPEAERQQMLKQLDENREKVAAEIAKLPFVIDTVGLRKKKQALENKIKEIDNAVRIFSRKKVYVEQ